MAEAAQSVLLNGKTAAQALVYGPDPGHETLRSETASWLTDFYCPAAGTISPSRVFITNGASAALAMLLTRFTDPAYTRRIWMVEPTYFLACPTFQDAGFDGRLRGVPEDEQGLDISFLRHAILQSEGEPLEEAQKPPFRGTERCPKLYRHVIYAVPTFSNPSAKIMSLGRREELVKLAREFDALIITDDVYDWLRWPAQESSCAAKLAPPPPRLVDVDRSLPGGSSWGNAVSNGSFSKIVAPGMRVGWVEGSPQITEDLCKVGSVRSGGSQGHFSSMCISQLLSCGALQAHIHETLVPTYERRYRTMLRSIQQHLEPLGITIASTGTYEDDTQSQTVPVAGGFFLYLDFPPDSPSVELIAKLALDRYNLRVAHGRMMVVAGDKECAERAEQSFGQGARLCWAWHEDEDIVEGIQRLAMTFNDVQNNR